jgi:hypothetical protein
VQTLPQLTKSIFQGEQNSISVQFWSSTTARTIAIWTASNTGGGKAVIFFGKIDNAYAFVTLIFSSAQKSS